MNEDGKTRRLAERLRRTGQYRNWRRGILGRNPACFFCGPGKPLTVHHVRPICSVLARNKARTIREALALSALWDEKNAVVVCRDCHDDLHSHRKTITQEDLRRIRGTSEKLRGQMKHVVMLDDDWGKK